MDGHSPSHDDDAVDGAVPPGGTRTGTLPRPADDQVGDGSAAGASPDDVGFDAWPPPGWAARRMAGPTEDFFPPGLTARRWTRGRIVAVVLAGIVVVAGGVAWAVSRSGGPTPTQAVVTAVQRTVAQGPAELSATMVIGSPGAAPTTASGHGVLDVGHGASRLIYTFGPGALAGERLQEVFVGQTVYLSLPQLADLVPGKPWIAQPLSPGAIIAPRNADLAATLGMLGAAGNRVVDLGATHIDGADTHAYSVTVQPGTVAASSGRADLPGPLVRAASASVGTTPDVVTVYVDDASGSIRRVAADVDLTVGTHPTVARMAVDLRPAGHPTPVTAPPSSAVQTLAQLQAAVAGQSPTLST
jgi:hypothetical protein